MTASCNPGRFVGLARFSAIPAAAEPSVAAMPAGALALERLQAWPGEHRVAVGLSGGVDSSLTAALLVEAGWQVEGLTLWLMSGKGACCAEGLVDAAGICEQLGVEHHVVDFREHFKEQIVDFLVQGYGDGITPLRRDVVDAAWWIYQNHEAIKASGRKVFRAADRAVFPSA